MLDKIDQYRPKPLGRALWTENQEMGQGIVPVILRY
jgi:hypothetical protein